MKRGLENLDLLAEVVENRLDYSCENEKDPLSSSKIETLDPKRIFNMQGKCFDLQSLFNWVFNEQKYTNPFTNEPFKAHELESIKKEAFDKFPLKVNIVRKDYTVPEGESGVTPLAEFETSVFTNTKRLFINFVKSLFNVDSDSLEESLKLVLNNADTELVYVKIPEGEKYVFVEFSSLLLMSITGREMSLNFNEIDIYVLSKSSFTEEQLSASPYQNKLKKQLEATKDLVTKVFGVDLEEIIENPNVVYYAPPVERLVSGTIKVTFSLNKEDEKPLPQNDLTISFHRDEFVAGYKKKYSLRTTIREVLKDIIESISMKMGNLGLNDRIAIINRFDVNIVNSQAFVLTDTLRSKFKNKIDRNNKLKLDIFINGNNMFSDGRSYNDVLTSFSVNEIMTGQNGNLILH